MCAAPTGIVSFSSSTTWGNRRQAGPAQGCAFAGVWGRAPQSVLPASGERQMEYRQLGRSGLRVSAIGLGGNTFGNGADEAQTGRIINRALDLGINFIDTADVYSRGTSETFVGKA